MYQRSRVNRVRLRYVVIGFDLDRRGVVLMMDDCLRRREKCEIKACITIGARVV